MRDDQFTKLFKYLTEHFDAIDRRFDDTDHKFSQLQTSVDDIAKDLDNLKLEVTSQNQQLRRHEDWIERAAPKLKIDYDPAS